MEKKFDVSKYKKNARILERIIKVLYIIGIIVTAIGFIAGIVLLFIPQTSPLFTSGNDSSVNLTQSGILQYQLDADTSIVNMKSMSAAIAISTAAVSLIPTLILREINLILKTVRNDRPFAPENSKGLFRAAVILIVGAFVTRAGETYLAQTVVSNLKLSKISVSFSADTTMILIGLMFFALSGIFRYGSYLQKGSKVK